MQHTCARRPLAFSLAALISLTAIAALVGPPPARACPPPPTFSEMIGMADVIVTGSITEVARGTIRYENDISDISIATVRIEEVIKGSVDEQRTLRVMNVDATDLEQTINGDNPGPDAEEISEVPLSMRKGLFLLTGSGDVRPDSVAPWSGMRVYDITDDAARDGLVPIIRGCVALDAIQDPLKRRAAQLEWIVQCAENEMTRRDGFYDFSRADEDRSWRMESEDESDRDAVEAKVAFTDGQIDRLVTVWIESLDKRDDGAMWFGNALGDYRGELVASRLLDAIAAEGEGGTNDIGTWMSTVASIYEWRSGHLLTEKFWGSENPEERAALVRRFVELAPLRAEIPEAIVIEGADEDVTESVEDVESEAVTEIEDAEREAVEAIEQVGIEDGSVDETFLLDASGPIIELVARPDELNKP